MTHASEVGPPPARAVQSCNYRVVQASTDAPTSQALSIGMGSVLPRSGEKGNSVSGATAFAKFNMDEGGATKSKTVNGKIVANPASHSGAIRSPPPSTCIQI